MLSIYSKIKKELDKSREESSSMGYSTCENVVTLACALEMTREVEGSFVECGVFEGNTLITSAIYMKNSGIDKKVFGIDTFEGFVPSQSVHRNDAPEMFEKLYESGKITKDHLEKSKERISKNKLKNSHLSSEYFSLSSKSVFKDSKSLGVNLIKGKFSDVLPSFSDKISVLHIDCDLYEPYLECLNLLYEKVSVGGIVVFDEYYSLKYPGARIAVDEFLSKRKDFSLNMFLTGEFERWYLTKK